jgi:hypothetical protein
VCSRLACDHARACKQVQHTQQGLSQPCLAHCTLCHLPSLRQLESDPQHAMTRTVTDSLSGNMQDAHMHRACLRSAVDASPQLATTHSSTAHYNPDYVRMRIDSVVVPRYIG